MTRLALVSDSHIPGRAARIPDAFAERIRAADRVVHAGDLTSADALARIEELAGDLVAVRGNMDGRDLGLPATATLAVGGVTVVATHGTGSPRGYEERVARTVREEGGDVGVAGHTHEVLDATVGGVRLLNPGSVTGASPADRPTMMTAEVAGGDLDVRLHEL